MNRLRGWRLVCLLLAVVLLAVAITDPHYELEQPVYSFMAVVDITRSMNTRDYRLGDLDISRLETVRRTLKEMSRTLPCGSRLGVSLFTERRAAVLLMPVEVCDNYAPLAETIDHIDWRMAWAADSNIMQGLYNTLELMRDLSVREMLNADLLFITDGHEAPPPNPNYMPDLKDFQNQGEWQPGGLVIGVGGDELSRIPKHNQEGEMIGYYGADDVTQVTSFGLPEDPESIEGYHPRNAPWGNRDTSGNEHLSSLKESYLLELAGQSGLDYIRLETPAQLATDIQEQVTARRVERPVRIHFIPAMLALAAVLALYVAVWFRHIAALLISYTIIKRYLHE
ncbi:mxaL protein [Methylohalomonas lacus]|uniref:MxaL protein n=1 Tax=Methylohalomonas lacus TaxID=398773 RepID=A0AAE3HKK9_9GAMM|nr:vWA domain-containing protein [Methylohalomonas lacus]MCS3902158.1 mxaL protein [Methylohalomonas lacus]